MSENTCFRGSIDVFIWWSVCDFITSSFEHLDMNRRYILVFLGTVFVIAVAAQLLNMGPEQRFMVQMYDASRSTYHVEYDIEASGLGGLFTGAVERPELYAKRGESKFVFGVLGTTFASYGVFDNRTVTCTEGSVLGLESGQDISCSASYSDYSVEEIRSGLENASVSIEGTETVAGRECRLYIFEDAEEVAGAMPPEAGLSNYPDSRLEVCLDSDKGYPATIRVVSNQSSELRSDEEGPGREILAIRAVDYSADVSDSVFEIPVDTSVSLGCEPFHANITTFDYGGGAVVSVNGQNRTLDLPDDAMERMELETGDRVSGLNRVEVYTDGRKSSDICYHYSFEGLFNSTYDGFDYGY